MPRLGFSLSMIGGLWFIGLFIFVYMQTITMFPHWDPPPYMGYIPSLLVGIACVIGVIIGFKSIKAGTIICFIAGIIYPIINFDFFIMMFFSFLSVFYMNIPMILVLVGAIAGLIELLREKE